MIRTGPARPGDQTLADILAARPNLRGTHLLPDLLTRDDLRDTQPLAVVQEDWVRQP